MFPHGPGMAGQCALAAEVAYQRQEAGGLQRQFPAEEATPGAVAHIQGAGGAGQAHVEQAALFFQTGGLRGGGHVVVRVLQQQVTAHGQQSLFQPGQEHGLEAALPRMAGLRPVGGPRAAAGPAT